MVIQNMEGEIVDDVQQVLRDLRTDVSFPAALDRWQARTRSHLLDLVIATIHVQMETGGNLADKFQLISLIIPHLQQSPCSVNRNP